MECNLGSLEKIYFQRTMLERSLLLIYTCESKQNAKSGVGRRVMLACQVCVWRLLESKDIALNGTYITHTAQVALMLHYTHPYNESSIYLGTF